MTWRGSLFSIGARAKSTAGPAALRVLFEGAKRIVNAAEPRWPVASGASQKSLHVVLSGRDVRIVAIYYAPFILSRGVRPWEAYIAGPLRQWIVYEAPGQVGQAVIRALAEAHHG